jgi:flagellar biosynthesis/type III secretory pathway protein FliH
MSHQSHRLNLPYPLNRVSFSDPKAAELEDAIREKERAVFERGRIEGEKRLSEQLLQQRGDLLALQQGVFKSLQQAVPQVVRDCEQALTALTVEVAQKLVANIPISAEMVEATVREALSHVEETTDYHLYLNPDDLDLLERLNSPLLSAENKNQQFHFHRSPEITRGGCLVKRRFGVVDAQRETKVELLKQSLFA